MTVREVSISEAARILGVSRRTVYRQIEAGALHSVQVGGARRVILDAASINPVATSDNDTENAQLRAQVAALSTELEATRQDRDRWHGHAQRLGTTIDRLTVTTAQLGDRIIEHRAIESGLAPEEARPETASEELQAAPRPWWAFWRS
jgi:excisionase family DNA binding protein